MFKTYKKVVNWHGKTIELETGKIARQATAAVVAKIGGTVVLCTVVAEKTPKEGIGFFPLSVHYQEKFYAAGKIPGGFFKREAKPTEHETLVSRLIDRPIRPLFPEGFCNEVQIVCTVLSYDAEHEADIIATIGASAALTISGIPFAEPIAAARVGYIDGKLILNPSRTEIKESTLDLVVAGTESSVLMVESEAKELSEEDMLKAVMFGHTHFQPIIQAIKEFADEIGNPRWELVLEDNADIKSQVETLVQSELREAYREASKTHRVQKIDAAKDKVIKELVQKLELNPQKVQDAFENLQKDIVRKKIIDESMRIDGRTPIEIRNIVGEVDLLPQPHGSALFTRGETQALCVITLGTETSEQMVDNLHGLSSERFILHYNFPPFSVGEVGPMRGPGRREIGHGKLALRALNAVIPTKDTFPYTIRIVSEITESNGSSSMATVCGSSMSMMAAGIPIKSAVSGIAMGLIKEGDKFVILSDIMGDEDHLGDMDFKVAGTESGITALQMDIKINGINEEIMRVALSQAHKGRLHILSKMAEAIAEARSDLSTNAPRITTIKIGKDKIRDVIGSGGKVIRDICEKSGTLINISDDGTVKIASSSESATKIALDMINGITITPEVGEVYEGVVIKLVDFGAVVSFLGGMREGLLHISEFTSERGHNISSFLNMAQTVKIKITSVDHRTGKVKLGLKDKITTQLAEIDNKAASSIHKNTEDDANESSHKKKKTHTPSPQGDHEKREKSERPERDHASAEPAKKKKRFF